MAALTFSHLSSDTFQKESQKKAGRKRPRIREAVSCYQCRSRKIRCNRETPCRTCVERGAGNRCTYSQTKTTTTASSTKPISPKTQEAALHGKQAQDTDGRTPAEKQEAQGTAALPSRPIAAPMTVSAKALPTISSRTRNTDQKAQDTSSKLPFKGHIIQGSTRKTRLIGVSYWMAPCNEMMVIKTMLSSSGGFQASMKEFAGLKERLRLANTVTVNLPPYSAAMGGRLPASVLLSVLPDRPSCEQWIGRFFQGYGRVFDIVDATTLATDLHQAFSCPADAKHSYATALDSVYTLRILVTTALGMQMSEPHRLHGRRLGCLVEDFIHRASRVHKPCIGSVQVLLLLLLLKTVMASDTDGEYDSVGLFGLTSQIVSSMGLHRHPALFDIASPYYAEQRKRLWACYLRLNLTYCIRTGSQLALRLDDVDCPLPLPSILKVPSNSTTLSNGIEACASEWMLEDKEAQNDAAFNYAYAKLANVVAPVHQTLCSAKPRVTVEQQAALQSGFAALVSDLPSSLKTGTSVTEPIIELQRVLLSVGMHSFLLVVSLSSVLRNSTEELVATGDFVLQRPQLLEIWDYTTSILNQYQSLCKKDDNAMPHTPKSRSRSKSLSSVGTTNSAVSDVSTISHHLLWTDAGRAALSGCLVVGRLRRHDLDKTMPFSVHPQQQHTASIFQPMLTQSLSVLLELWRGRSHLGPVIAKSSMVIAVAIAVTVNLYTDFDGIFEKGVEAADQLITEVRSSLEQRLSQHDPTSRIRDSGVSMDDAAAVTAAVNQVPVTTQPPQQLQVQALNTTTMPPPVIVSSVVCDSMSFAAPEVVQQQVLPLPSTQVWAPVQPMFDNNVVQPQMTDLSAAGSSAGSQTTTPDFGCNTDLFGLDFNPNMTLPFAMTSSFDANCALMGDFDSTFMDFSGDTVVNIF